jgi:hypothetical protein
LARVGADIAIKTKRTLGQGRNFAHVSQRSPNACPVIDARISSNLHSKSTTFCGGRPAEKFCRLHRLIEHNPRIEVWTMLKGYDRIGAGSAVLINGTRVALTWDEPMPGVPRPWFFFNGFG